MAEDLKPRVQRNQGGGGRVIVEFRDDREMNAVLNLLAVSAERPGREEPVGWALFNPDTGKFRSGKLFANELPAKIRASDMTDNYTRIEARPLFAHPAPVKADTAGEGWKPVNTAPCDGKSVVLGNPEWDGVVTRAFYSEADRDAKLANWGGGPTVWMRPAVPATPEGERA